MKAHKKDLKTTYAPMQHRHFATIAGIIRDLNERPEYAEEASMVAKHFARHLASTNPNFNSERFIAACLDSED